MRQELFETLEGQGKDVAETIRQLRKILGYDQKTFANYVGISLSTLRKIEQQRDNYSLTSLSQILDKFSLKLVIKVK